MSISNIKWTNTINSITQNPNGTKETLLDPGWILLCGWADNWRASLVGVLSVMFEQIDVAIYKYELLCRLLEHFLFFVLWLSVM